MSGWHDAAIDAKSDGFAILVRGEDEAVIVAELQLRGALSFLFVFEDRVVVGLVQDNRLLSQSDILEDLFEIERPLADVIVGLEDVEVPRLHDQHERVLARRLNIEQNSVVERSFAVGASEVSVTVLLVFIVDIAPDENVRHTLKVLARHIFSVHHREADLVVLYRLLGDIPHLLLLSLLITGLNLEPARDHTLR